VSGGTTNTNFLVGVGWHKETTVFPGDFNDRKGSLHFNLNNTSADKKFTFNLSGSYLLDNNQLPSMDLLSLARSLAPDAPALRNEDGSINWAQDSTGRTTFFNPLAELNKRYKIETRNLIGNMMLGYEVLPGLEISTSLGYTNLQSDEIVTTPVTYYRPEIRPQFGNLLRRAQYGNNNISTWIAEPQISYKKTIGNGKMEALLGTTFHDINSSGQQLTGSTYNSDLVLEDIRSAASVKVDNSVRSTYRYNALFARLGYTWDRKYIINVTARRDGSSRFGSANLFNNFGAVAGAWIFSDENFIKQALPFISFGKLRLSYGTTGNDQIGDYQFLNLYNPIGVSVPYQESIGLEPVGLPNPYLQWEETKKLQGGIELGFWNDRILLNAGYYHNRSSNQLLDYVLSIFTGFSSIPQNFPATIQNTGWELSLNSVNVRSSTFNWSSSINVTIPKNKLVSFPGLEQSSYATQVIVGEPFTIKKVYRFAGVDPAIGVYQFYDAEGKLTTTPDPSNDATKLINTSPEFFGGFQNSVSYKKIALSFLFQFVKQKGQNYALGGIPPGVYHNNQPVTVLDRWQNAGDDKPIQRFNSDFSLYQSLNDALSSDGGFTDASYVRLKNISFSWELPGKWTNRARLENVSIYVQGQNLLTFTGYDGYDPENRSTESIPPLRIITFGVRLTL
jgi:TonB-linked SusC/RagA family outer membrane protein